MVAIGRTLMAQPKLLLMDEPSMGLAPMVVRNIFKTIQILQTRGYHHFFSRTKCQSGIKNRRSGLCSRNGEDHFRRRNRRLVE